MFKGRNYINGQFCNDHKDFASVNPSTEEDLGFFPVAQHDEVAEAVDAAWCSHQRWREVSRVKRAEYFDNLAQLLKRDHDKLVQTISLETGKNKNESHAEILEALHMCQFVAGSGRTPCGDLVASELATKDAYVMRKPKGVVAVISPWNFPAAIGSFWSSAPAIAEGNCVVHKPSEYTPMIAQMIAELYHESGFPAGVYNLVHGMEDTGKELVRDNHVDCILFTGSAEVGKEIKQQCASTWHKSCSCEMGSKSAVMVFDDANLNLALDVSIASAFKLSGQRCVSAGRILVHKKVVDRFTQAFVERVNALETGSPFSEPAPYYGPLIHRDAVTRVAAFNDLARDDEDVKVLVDGGPIDREGYFISPFVYKTEWHKARFLSEEVFGPHVAIIPFSDTDQAISIYNDTEYGLACGVVTDNFRTMRQCRDNCRAGMIYLNGGSVAAESHLPFGGLGKSGNGWKSAAGTYRAVTEEVAVTVNYEEGISWAQGMK